MARVRTFFSFKSVVFDLDGTLVDSVSECARIFAETACLQMTKAWPYKDWNIKEVRSFYRDTTGMPLREQYRACFAKNHVAVGPQDIEELRDAFNYRFLKVDVEFFDGALEFIKRISGYAPLFLSSASSDATVAKRLGAGRINRYFHRTCGSTAIPKGQAHIDHFAASLDMTPKAFARRACMCGDGETDMRIAVAAGMYPIGILGTVSADRLRAAGAKRVISSVAELIDDPHS